MIDYARDIGASFLIRGVRNATDASFETTLASQNRELAPEIATVLLPADPEFAGISSSDVRARVARGGRVDHLCHPEVAAALAEPETGRR